MADQKRIAELFKITTRVVNLSWVHHQQVSSIKKIKKKEDDKLFLSKEPDVTGDYSKISQERVEISQ